MENQTPVHQQQPAKEESSDLMQMSKMDSVSISEVSPTRLYAARCMLSLKHSLLQGRKKSKDEDYSPHTTKKKSLKRTQPTRLSFPPLPEAPRSITIDMEMEMERKNPLSSHSDADDSSSIGAVSYDEVIRVCKDISSRPVGNQFSLQTISALHSIPQFCARDICSILQTSGVVSTVDSNYVVQPSKSIQSILLEHRSEDCTKLEESVNILSVLTAKPPMDFIPSLLETEGTDVRLRDWKVRSPSSMWIHGAYYREEDSGYPFVVYPPHYDVPYRSDEPPEVTQSRLLPGSLPSRRSSTSDVDSSHQDPPKLKTSDSFLQTNESIPIPQKSEQDDIKDHTWSAELNTDSCLVFLTHLILRKAVMCDSFSMEEVTKEIYPPSPIAFLRHVNLICIILRCCGLLDTDNPLFKLDDQIRLNSQFVGFLHEQKESDPVQSSTSPIDIDCLASEVVLASIQSGQDIMSLSDVVRKRCGEEPFPSVSVMEAALKKRFVSAMKMYEIVVRERQEVDSVRK